MDNHFEHMLQMDSSILPKRKRDEAEDGHEAIRQKTAHSEDQHEVDADDLDAADVADISSDDLARMQGALLKKINKNQLMRAKYPGNASSCCSARPS